MPCTGYIAQERNAHDRRSIRTKLTEKGMTLCVAIRDLQSHLASQIDASADTQGSLDAAARELQRVDRIWGDFLRYGRT